MFYCQHAVDFILHSYTWLIYDWLTDSKITSCVFVSVSGGERPCLHSEWNEHAVSTKPAGNQENIFGQIDNKSVSICKNVLWTMKEDDECVKQARRCAEKNDSSSGCAVAARNGLWVTLRCRPYCAAAVKPECTTWLSSVQLRLSFLFQQLSLSCALSFYLYISSVIGNPTETILFWEMKKLVGPCLLVALL